jgi:hypothetical protein
MSSPKKAPSKKETPTSPISTSPVSLPIAEHVSETTSHSEVALQPNNGGTKASTSVTEDDNYLPFLSIKEDRPKYPSLQTRNLMYFRMSPKLTAKMIHLLEQTGWTQTDAGNLILNSFFLMNKCGVFQLLMDRKRLESDDINDLRANRDMLLNVSKELENILKISIWKIYRREQKEDISNLHV